MSEGQQPSGMKNMLRAVGGALPVVPRGTTVPDRTLTVDELSIDPANANNLIAGIGRFSSFGSIGGPLTGVLLTNELTTVADNFWSQPCRIGGSAARQRSNFRQTGSFDFRFVRGCKLRSDRGRAFRLSDQGFAIGARAFGSCYRTRLPGRVVESPNKGCISWKMAICQNLKC